ncbi:putative iron-regulated membrane protein [Nitrospira japonica]|uniref:Putative iron-regulated membrane protein n=1 Tax=Nitrospira japonica TaxID=1325564 RepID=A0A1W1IAS9_9BACT|nr:PepSY-associated TM helix domain-containing protein [Nitrospira japonica]SLM50102.1 putative iron-regulated membrane protein [Nitrospira japonica]
MRAIGVTIHRWAGLFTALFLFVSGLTGAVISWDHEIDEWLNDHLFDVSNIGPSIPYLELAARIEAADPRVRVSQVPLQTEPGRSLLFGVQPRVDPQTGKLYKAGYNQVFLDPVTGKELGRREWGAVAVDREHLMAFLYRLHYTLHIPNFAGQNRWGQWFMGGIAIIWLLDCFVALAISFPDRFRWRRSFWIRHGSRYQLNFDLHRAGGLWTWGVLLVLAVSAVYLNLNREIVRPAVAAVATVTPNPFDVRTQRPLNQPIEPRIDYAAAIANAQEEAQRKRWQEPVGAASYNARYGIYQVRFFQPGNDHGSGGFGVRRLYFDGLDGAYLGELIPGSGTAGDLFLQIQFPLHSGRIAGIPGRIFISIMGLVVAGLSVTGVVIWMKRRGRLSAVSAAFRRAAM